MLWPLALLKVPLDRYRQGSPIFHSEVAVWEIQDDHKPPHISSAPCVTISLSKKEIQLFYF